MHQLEEFQVSLQHVNFLQNIYNKYVIVIVSFVGSYCDLYVIHWNPLTGTIITQYYIECANGNCRILSD